jgi:hypothetical protein
LIHAALLIEYRRAALAILLFRRRGRHSLLHVCKYRIGKFIQECAQWDGGDKRTWRAGLIRTYLIVKTP